ncbi:oligoendopeptidase F [Anaeromyxobacter sp. SG26]|uniref:oligoendopeptidase F n=1 Tax=Anaeromyxobacter sp. SG26 TaxID=2925407 RepID=UPI001F57ACA9|nr:oligoendopeptidase F [Anaeromyxobacter sp. SG26]
MRPIIALLFLLAAAPTSAAATRKTAPPGPRSPRSAETRDPEALRWDLTALYPSDAAWSEAKAALGKDVAGFRGRHEGRLGASAKALADGLADLAQLRERYERLFAYAMLRSDGDVKAARPRELRQEAERLGVELEAAASFVRPELLAVDAAKVKAFLKEDPRLAQFDFFLSDLLRWKDHTLSPREERIVAQAGELEGAAPAVHGVLTNADIPWPTVKLSTGEQVRLDPAGYQRARTAPSAADREKVFRAFFDAVKTYERTLGAAMDAQVKGHRFEKDVRGFRSSLESALFAANIPPAVYHQLVADVNRSLPTLHRYLALRKRMLGLSELRYEDLYAPLVKDVERRYTPAEGVALTLEAVAPLGAPYVEALRSALDGRWTDFLPRPGKRSGAYSMGVYAVHPYQLLNFNGQWEDVSTLAHESGHTMHSALAARAQPFPKYDYPTFVAEVASTLNENLLLHRVLDRTKDDATRLFLLGRHLETLRTTLFRQTMFAEFELAVHERAEKGEALSGEALSTLYLELVRKYYGHAQGLCRVDARYGVEWASVPHFFNYDFYVFQYATSLVASTSLAKAIREEAVTGGTAARDRYLAMLSAGGSRYAIDLLKDAGVDMTTSAPFAAAMDEMNRVMDEMDAILGRAGHPRAAR